MDVRTCRKCRRLFNYIAGQPICPVCRDEIEQKFQVVKKFISDNRGSDIADVADACDVDPQQIRQWIREERLQFSDDSPIGINCELCGATIRSGRFCDKCRMNMTNSFSNAIGADKLRAAQKAQMDAPQKASPKMRFLDK